MTSEEMASRIRELEAKERQRRHAQNQVMLYAIAGLVVLAFRKTLR